MPIGRWIAFFAGRSRIVQHEPTNRSSGVVFPLLGLTAKARYSASVETGNGRHWLDPAALEISTTWPTH
jgi:hypothetical protein